MRRIFVVSLLCCVLAAVAFAPILQGQSDKGRNDEKGSQNDKGGKDDKGGKGNDGKKDDDKKGDDGGRGDEEGLSEIIRGFLVAAQLGIPLNLSGKNLSLVGRGSYLVNGVSECLGCHIVLPPGPYKLGNNPFMGEPARVDLTRYLSGGRPFGPAISRNLTPDKNGLPAGLTYDQFEQVMRVGADYKALEPHVPGNPGVLQAMPWPQFRWATENWIRSIYEYLRAIPCLEGGPGTAPNRC